MKLPTGDEAKGFGAGTPRARGFVLWDKLLGDDSFLQLQGVGRIPARRRARGRDLDSGRLGRTWTVDKPFGRAWTPMIEVLGAKPLDERRRHRMGSGPAVPGHAQQAPAHPGRGGFPDAGQRPLEPRHGARVLPALGLVRRRRSAKAGSPPPRAIKAPFRSPAARLEPKLGHGARAPIGAQRGGCHGQESPPTFAGRPSRPLDASGGCSPRWRWLAGGALVRPAAAQSAAEGKILSADELADVVGPIALYPDDLVGIVLPASTYPLQIVEAARFLDKRKQDPSLKPSEDWDDSVVALLNYPEVVQLVERRSRLDLGPGHGRAEPARRRARRDPDVPRPRARRPATCAPTTTRPSRSRRDGAIAIAPADPQVIYVPYYEPERVVVYQTRARLRLLSVGLSGLLLPVSGRLCVRHRASSGASRASSASAGTPICCTSTTTAIDDHPYYGSTYYGPYYARNYINVNVNVGARGSVWQPALSLRRRPSSCVAAMAAWPTRRPRAACEPRRRELRLAQLPRRRILVP